ncbi:hypothetical protein RND81_07G149100 [Saponaria officinalis]|uniref:Glutaredoxin domain-containing protein n=1 Tax=Saponaria officinalis TaxID=3572 RepID=A0AAW1JRX8_SAPOF
MQEALPYKRWELEALPRKTVPSASHIDISSDNDGDEENKMVAKIVELVKDNPVIVIGKEGCCMCHVARKLLIGLGVNPPVFEINCEINELLLIKLLCNNGISDVSSVTSLQFPIVFVGGKFFGGLDKVMGTHLSGDLVPILKQAGALWL